MKIAIIGAGASGLPAIRCCLEEGLDPVCFERTDDIGGLWNWKETPTEGQSTVMRTTIINTSKEMSFYSDFPAPPDYPNFMPNWKVLSYFRLYADHFGLMKHIKFRTSVIRVSQADNFKKTGRWVLELKDLISGSTRTEEFDGVLVCSGHHANKKMPHFEGQEEFEGKILHTHDYTDHRGYEKKRVIVVGIGNSGVDVTVELSKLSDQVYLSTRRGAWVIGRIGDNGEPFDLSFSTRFGNFLFSWLPRSLFDYLYEKKVNARFDHSRYGLKPSHHFTQQHPTLNDDLANRLIAGNVIVKPDIRRLHKRSVEFDDGTVVDNIDAIICATGYLFGFPFVDHKSLEVKDNQISLYKLVFPPGIAPSTIGVIGCLQPLGGIMPCAEMQCRWATRVIKRGVTMPSEEEMRKDIEKKKDALSCRYVKSTRHTIQVDYVAYMDELAELCGCKPNMPLLFRTDPKLAFAMLFGPAAPYHYRVMGHGSWTGARDAILTIMDRVFAPLKTRKTPDENDGGTMRVVVILIVVVTIISILLSRWLRN